MPDPAEVEGSDDAKLDAFRETLCVLQRRVGLFLALPVESLEPLALQARIRRVAEEGA